MGHSFQTIGATEPIFCLELAITFLLRFPTSLVVRQSPKFEQSHAKKITFFQFLQAIAQKLLGLQSPYFAQMYPLYLS